MGQDFNWIYEVDISVAYCVKKWYIKDDVISRRSSRLNFLKSQELPKILSSMTLEKPVNSSEYQKIVLVDETETNITRKMKNAPAAISNLILWYKDSKTLPMTLLIDFVVEQLSKRNHPANQQIAEVFLALFALTRKHDVSTVEHLQEQLNSIYPSEATVFYVMPVGSIPHLPELNFGPYTYGELDLRELKKLDKKSKSNYLREYRPILKGRMTITRKMPDLGLMDWIPFLENMPVNIYMIKRATVAGWVTDTYYDHINRFLFDMFFDEMLQHQEVAISLGSLYITPDKYRNQHDVITIIGYVFNTNTRNKSTGHISSQLQYYSPSIDPAIFDQPYHHENLRKQYNFVAFEDTPLHHTLQTFTKFVARAKILEDKRRPSASSAFLTGVEIVGTRLEVSTESFT